MCLLLSVSSPRSVILSKGSPRQQRQRSFFPLNDKSCEWYNDFSRRCENWKKDVPTDLPSWVPRWFPRRGECSICPEAKIITPLFLVVLLCTTKQKENLLHGLLWNTPWNTFCNQATDHHIPFRLSWPLIEFWATIRHNPYSSKTMLGVISSFFSLLSRPSVLEVNE